jgi:DNA-binding protein Fis
MLSCNTWCSPIVRIELSGSSVASSARSVGIATSIREPAVDVKEDTVNWNRTSYPSDDIEDGPLDKPVHSQGPPGSAEAATYLAEDVVLETRISYLTTLASTMLHELESLRELRHASRKPRLTLKDEVHRFETELIRNALITTFGSQRGAADILGMNPTTLNTKIKKFKIPIPAGPSSISQSTRPAIDEIDSDWSLGLNDAKAQFEIEVIKRALREVGGDQRKAARLLQIAFTTLNSKIRKYRLDPVEFSVRGPGGLSSEAPADLHRRLEAE